MRQVIALLALFFELNVCFADKDEDSKKFGGRLRNGGAGVLLTPGAGPGRSKAYDSREFLQSVLEDIGKEAIDAKGIHVRVNVYSSYSENAFANQPVAPDGEKWPIHRFLGTADDGKPIYEILVLQGLYESFRSKDEIAFLLGHELGHIISGHTKPSTNEKEMAQKWYDSQANEVEADFYAFSVMKGKYDLEAGYDFMERLLSGVPQLSAFQEFSSTHHHPSVRLAGLLSRILQLRRSDPEAAPRERQPIPKDALVAKGGARDNPISLNLKEYREEYFRWFDQFMAPREKPVMLHSRTWENEKKAFPQLGEARLYKDGARALFVESLERIKQMPNLSRTEKLERVFELLSVSKHVLFTKTGSNTAESSLYHLGDREAAALKDSFRELGFSKGTVEEAHAFTEQFNARTITLDWSYNETSTSTEFLWLMAAPKIREVFELFTKASPQWSNWQKSLLQTEPGVESQNVQNLASRFKTGIDGGFKESETQGMIEKLKTLSFSEAYKKERGLFEVQQIMTLRSKALSDGCENPEFCKALVEMIDRNEPEFIGQLKKHLNEILAKDPATIDPRVLDLIAYDVGHSLISGNSHFARGLTPSEMEAEIPKLWSWYEAAKRRLEGTGSRHLSSLRRDIAEPVMHGLAQGAFPKEKSIDIYREVASQWPYFKEQPFLRTLSTAEVRKLFLEEPFDVSKDPRLVADLVIATGLPADEIKRHGVTIALLDKIREGRTPDELEELVNSNRETLNSRIYELREMQVGRKSLYKELLSDSAVNKRVLSEFSVADLVQMTNNMRLVSDQEFVLHSVRMPGIMARGDWDSWKNPRPYAPKEVDLLTALIEHQKSGIALKDWARVFENILSVESFVFSSVPLETQIRLHKYLDVELSKLPASERMAWLERPDLLSVLPADRAAFHLAEAFATKIPNGSSVEQTAELFHDLQKRLGLKGKHAELNHALEAKVAENLKLQPGMLKFFFPPHANDISWQDFSGHIRGGSGIVGQIQKLPVAEQIEFVDYILGRSDEVPESIKKIQAKVEENHGKQVNFENLTVLLRAKLAGESSLMRSLVILPFYTGENSITGKDGGTEILVDKVLAAVSEQNRELARELAQGILTAEGKNGPVAFALLFGQRPEHSGALKEGEVLRALFQAYGVPGTKFGQYLAFASEFEGVREHLSSLQDQAMPLSYLEVIQMLEKKFPNGLPDGIEILGIKGSGSVNIGVEYYNPKTRQEEILTVSREAVETSTQEDFRRMRKIFEVLSKTPEGAARYGFMLGLDDITRKSVELEFDRGQVFKNQAELSKIMDREVNGWRVKMVEPYSVENGVIRMQKAKGTPATVLAERDAKTYREAMGAASIAITDHLMREDGAAAKGFNSYADSDFHNGQAFIDKSTKTVWLIDPGQAVAITAEEHDVAKRILRVLSGVGDLSTGVSLLNRSVLNPHPDTPLLTVSEVRSLVKGKEPADAFIKLVSLVRKKGGEIPLPVVQWVLGMNRQLVLSRKLDVPLERRMAIRFAKDAAVDVGRRVFDGIGRVFKRAPASKAEALELQRQKILRAMDEEKSKGCHI